MTRKKRIYEFYYKVKYAIAFVYWVIAAAMSYAAIPNAIITIALMAHRQGRTDPLCSPHLISAKTLERKALI